MVSFSSAEWQAAWIGYELDQLNQRPKRAPHTIKTRKSSVMSAARRYADTPPEKLTKTDMRMYFLEEEERRKPGGLLSLYNDLKSFFKWVSADYGTEDPMKGVPVPKSDLPDVPVLEPDQMRALLATCKGKTFLDLRDAAVIWMLFETGLRRSELLGIQLDDLDQRAMTIRIRRGKGGKPRTAFYGKDTADALRRYLRMRSQYPGTALFLNYKRQPLCYPGVGELIKKRGDMAGIPGLHPHQLRHCTAHYLLDSGVSDSNTVILMGWNNGAQLKRYGRAKAVERAEKAVREHPLGDVLRRRPPAAG